jgi:hypothetical protein
LNPHRESHRAPLKKGNLVRWRADGDQGTVTGIIPGESVAILWNHLGRVEWYRIAAIEDRIEIVDGGEDHDWF